MGAHQSSNQLYQTYTFKQRYFSFGDDTLLKLKDNLELKLLPTEGMVEVSGWGLKLRVEDLPNLSSYICRRFLQVLRKAETEELSEQDQACAVAIMDSVDFQQFTIDRALPRKVSGILIEYGTFAKVDWNSGGIQAIPHRFAQALSVVDVGESFSAFVRFGIDGEILSLNSVMPLGKRPLDDSSWNAWPQKLS